MQTLKNSESGIISMGIEFKLRDPRPEELVGHASTAGALYAMEALLQGGFTPSTMLDIGCGSGVLSIAALSLWPLARVLASDIHPQAIEDARLNAEAGGVSERLECLRSDTPQLLAKHHFVPFNLIVANILAPYVIQHMPLMASMLSEDGVIIVAGLRVWERQAVEQAVEIAGCNVLAALQNEAWVCIVAKKNPRGELTG